MSDQWYILSGRQVRGPQTIAELRGAVASGEIDADTPVRNGTEGAWNFVRDVPELAADSVLPSSADLTPALVGRKRNNRLSIGILIVVAFVCVGTLARIQLRRLTPDLTAFRDYGR
jgi:hypothetical protein